LWFDWFGWGIERITRNEVSGAVDPLARSSATWISGCASLPM
jgi:hypothetical protein